jgi:manganese/zinc/iron transport system permease protein
VDGILTFFSIDSPNLIFVALGTLLLSISSSLVGTFTFLKKKALIGDAIAHSILPGICLAFILGGSKDPVYIIIGAFISGWISIISIDWITKNSKIKEDTAIALVLSVFFGFGLMLLVSIQHSGNANQSGLNNYLFGSAASLIGKDLITFSALSIILFLLVFMFYKEFKIVSFDRTHAISLGLPVKLIEFILSTMTVLAIVTGIQAIGVVLMAAMLITPAAAARFWTNKLHIMLMLSSLLASIAGLAGTYISYQAPSMPTGPWIILIISFIAITSFFIAPKKGIISKWLSTRKNYIKMLEENILKTFYMLGETDSKSLLIRSAKDLSDKRYWNPKQLKKGLNRLVIHGYLKKSNMGWQLTHAGMKKGQRVVRLHRLWELYLTEYLRIAPDHVHEDAETIEHVITPEIEKNILQTLDYPELDPHQSKIPYLNE